MLWMTDYPDNCVICGTAMERLGCIADILGTADFIALLFSIHDTLFDASFTALYELHMQHVIGFGLRIWTLETHRLLEL